MNKFKLHRMYLILSCVFFLALAIGILSLIIDSNASFDKYKEEGFNVEFRVEREARTGRMRFSTFYGTYVYNGRAYTGVKLYGNRDYKVGDVVECKLLTDDMYKVYDVSREYSFFDRLAEMLFYLADLALFAAAGWCIYSLYRHNGIMNRGIVEVGVIRSVVEKGDLCFGLVEFKDFNGNMHQVELCFEKRRRIPGQRCALKYLLNEDGSVEAYYYDIRE